VIRLDHIAIFVADEARARDWYVGNFGFRVEFEVPATHTVALVDDADVTLFLTRDPERARHDAFVLTLQVDDVEAKCRELSARGARFEKPPGRQFWGYGAELRDPDGHRVHLWDERTMREKGGA
jgi:catechol 2,3-dioxygenase-like lactoylglutathione lyase family enzyme